MITNVIEHKRLTKNGLTTVKNHDRKINSYKEPAELRKVKIENFSESKRNYYVNIARSLEYDQFESENLHKEKVLDNLYYSTYPKKRYLKFLDNMKKYLDD
jgi:hypothetical protein